MPRLPATGSPLRLGLDAFSLRSQGWTPFQCLDFCAERGLRVLHFSEARFLGGFDREHLRRVRAHASELGIEIEVGMRSICPSSTVFDPEAGTPEEQLFSALDAARLLGSPIVRCIVGRFPDRSAPGGIERRIEDTLTVLRAVRTRVLESGVKLAIENHAGDMQSRELRGLVERAGPEFVGVCLDSGNPLWALEDPRLALDTLAPYVLTSHVRDGVVWRTPEGAAVSWTRMGEGAVRIDEYLRTYLRRCPGRPVSLEVIVSDAPRVLPYHERDFWHAYGSMPSWEFVRFQALAESGRPVERRPLRDDERPAARELEDVEVSLEWTRRWLEDQESGTSANRFESPEMR